MSSGPGGVSVTVDGPQGPDYTLLAATNIPTTNWQPLFTAPSPTIPVTLVDTNNTNAARFYRLQLGP